MEGKLRNLFPGGNTSQGFYSFFDYIIPENVNRIFCLKGGPGVGKSSLMKKIAKEFLEKDYDLELHHCTSDPSSLDAIVIKELGVVLLDATAPHIVDPKTPGAVDEIVNLGDFWDSKGIEENKEKILSTNKDISNSFQRAFKFLKSAEPIYRDIEEKYTSSMDFGGINLFTENFIEELFKGTQTVGNYKKERHLFGSAITPMGHVDYTSSILRDAEKIYHLKGEIGTGKTTFLKRVSQRAIQKGMKLEIYHYPLVPEKIETIFIEDLKIGITTSSNFNENNIIDFNQYINEESIFAYNEELCFDKKLLDELINYAILNIKKAKAKHDIVENYYIPNMRFEEVEQLKDELVNKISKYESV